MKIKQIHNDIIGPVSGRYAIGSIVFATLLISALIGTHKKYGIVMSVVLVVLIYIAISLLLSAGLKIYGKLAASSENKE